MKSKITSYCHVCQKPMVFIKERPNHILHLILTFFTGGLWLIVWILLALSSRKPATCQGCGCAQNL